MIPVGGGTILHNCMATNASNDIIYVIVKAWPCMLYIK